MHKKPHASPHGWPSGTGMRTHGHIYASFDLTGITGTGISVLATVPVHWMEYPKIWIPVINVLHAWHCASD